MSGRQACTCATVHTALSPRVYWTACRTVSRSIWPFVATFQRRCDPVSGSTVRTRDGPPVQGSAM
eukprot:3306554-Pyramimonas_sp.AAC.1